MDGDDGFASGKLINGHESSPCRLPSEAHAADALDEQSDSPEQCGGELNGAALDTVEHGSTFQRVATVHGLQRKARSDATMRGLGGPGGLEGLIANLTRPERPHSAAPLRLVSASAPKSAARFPLGCTGREFDVKGRLKPHLEAGPLAELLGWQPGVLDTVIVDGYMTLSQQPEHIGVSGGRCGARIGFTVIASGVERISLRPVRVVSVNNRHEMTPTVRFHKHRIETGLFNVVDLLDSANARDRLRALNHLQILIRNEVYLGVRDACEMKMSWQDIGDVFGLSRQSAHERWGTDDDNIQYVSTDAIPMDDCTRGAIFRVFDADAKWLMSVTVHMTRSLEATGVPFHELPARAMRLVRRHVPALAQPSCIKRS